MGHAIRTYSKDDELVASRREEIARNVARVFVKRGYDRTSVREIVKACGMSTGTLYHYVGSKEDILYLVINHGISQYTDFFEEIAAGLDMMSPTEALMNAIREYYKRIEGFQDFTVFIYQETKNLQSSARQSVLDAERRLVNVFERLLIRGCETGEFNIDNVTLVAHDIVAVGEMWAVRRWFLRRCCTFEEYTRHHIDSFLKHISPTHPTGGCTS